MQPQGMLEPIFQYGFAGFAAVLLGILVWVVRALIQVLRENTRVIEANTHALEKLHGGLDELRENVSDLDRQLRGRPCLCAFPPPPAGVRQT